MRPFARFVALLSLIALNPPAFAAVPEKPPVLIGLDAEFGNRTSTADDAVKAGVEVAIDEINRAGGVLKGRPLVLVTRDNRGIPARGIDNLRELAALPDMAALVTAKFSPVVLAQIDLAHQLKLPILAAWSAADTIIDHGHQPSYTFRLSLRDGWVMPFLLRQAKARGYRQVGLLVPNGAWGRSNQKAAEAHLAVDRVPNVVKTLGFEWSDSSLANEYLELLKAGAEAVLFVGNEPEVARLILDMTALPRAQWRPILSHWGAAGGDLRALTGPRLAEVDVATVQTFTFIDNESTRAQEVAAAVRRKLQLAASAPIPSTVGVAHGYDLTQLLARAIDQAGSTDRAAIRQALERLGPYDGLVRKYAPPFTRDRHEALAPDQLFLARWRADGAIVRSAR